MREASEPIRTVGEHVYDIIRERILTGELAPGDQLVLLDLSNALAVSTTPVRAALARLITEGFVRQNTRRGAMTVAPLELEDFEEIQAVRIGVEGFAARLGAESMTELALSEMVTAFRVMESVRSATADNRLSEWFAAEWEMHIACYRASGRWRLIHLVHDYRNRAERYIRLAVGSAPGFKTPLEFQRQLLDASRARDGADAERVMRVALMWTMDEIRSILTPS